MSFHDIATETFLQISSYLGNVDKQCLRIACRGFMANLDPLPPVEELPIYTLSSQIFNHERERIQFRRRLFRKGNIFSKTYDGKKLDAGLCHKCLHVRPSSKFPVSSLRINDGEICESCIVAILMRTMSGGNKLSHGGRDYWRCEVGRGCKEIGGKGRMHQHGRLGSLYSRYCVRCHLRLCHDEDCPGWPEGFVDANRSHFSEACKICDHWHGDDEPCFETIIL